jgi:nucleoid-associated protein YgaU
VLDTIGYTDEGTVQLGGRAETGTIEVRAYLDNRAVARLPVDAQGNWRGEVPQVDAGVYTLRVDALSADGSVASRIETPFKREEPAVLAAAVRDSDGPVRAVTVQAGDTLWAIARDRYGEGLLYVQVFEANRSAIRNPDLIYPGQVFELPAD